MNATDIQHFFDQQAPEWDISYDEKKLAHLRCIFKERIQRLTPPVLDLGCGTGVLLKVFPDVLPREGSSILELDISMAMLLRISLQRQSNHSMPWRVQSDGHQLPLQSASTGSVVAFQVLPHFTRHREVFREVRRVLQPAGRLVILHLMDHETLNALHRNFGGAVQDHYLPPAEELGTVLKKEGFRIEKIVEEPDCYLLISTKI